MKILHFDINGTLIPQDKANKKDIIDGILSSLADEVQHSSGLSYKKYAESLYPGNDSLMKEKRIDLYRREMSFYMNNIHVERLDRAHEYTKMMYRDGEIVSLVPSFVQLINTLKEGGEPFRVHLRTFGHDMHDILPLVETLIGPMRVINLCQEYISYKELREIFRTENCAVIDNYEPWVNAHKNWREGKIFPVENTYDSTTHQRYISYFFDDNVQNNIVCPVVDGKLTEPSTLMGKHIFQVSMLDILNNVDYFLDLIQ